MLEERSTLTRPVPVARSSRSTVGLVVLPVVPSLACTFYCHNFCCNAGLLRINLAHNPKYVYGRVERYRALPATDMLTPLLINMSRYYVQLRDVVASTAGRSFGSFACLTRQRVRHTYSKTSIASFLNTTRILEFQWR